MKKEYFLIALFFLVTGIFFFLFYKLMAPFFTPVVWGGVLVIVFFPLYRWVGKKFKSPNISSFVTCVIIFFVIIGPAVYLLASLVGETSDAFTRVNSAYQSGELKTYFSKYLPFVEGIKNRLLSVYPDLANIDFDSVIKDAVATVSKIIGAKATSVLADITKTLFQFILTLFAMFFFFRDGDKIVAYLKRLTPLEPDNINITYSYLKEVIEGTMYGGVAMAIIQGALGGILFAIMGIDSAVFWGAIMAFLAFLPLIGPFLIYIPAGLYLILSGSIIKGIIIIAIGTIVISQIDNFVRPMLFRGKTKMHTLLLFFSIMGGIVAFGLVGVVLGPLVTAIFLTLLKIFELKIRPEEAIMEGSVKAEEGS